MSFANLIELSVPFLIRALIQWIQREDPPWQEGILLSLSIGVISHVKLYLFRFGVNYQNIIDHRLNSALRQSVFDKILSLPTTSLNLIDFGQITSMITSDQLLISINSFYLIAGTSSVVVLASSLTILAYFYGWYSIFAPFWIIVFFLLNNILVKFANPLYMRKIRLNDKIGVLANEIIKGIKSIKFNVWEKVTLEKVMDARKDESYSYSKFNIIIFIANNIGIMVPYSIIVCIYIFRTNDGEAFTLGDVYFLISLCSMLIGPTLMLMRTINSRVRTRLSYSRYDNFMALDFEKSDSKNESLLRGTVVLENYSATWVDPEKAD